MKKLGLFFNPKQKIFEKVFTCLSNNSNFSFYYFKNNGERCSKFASCYTQKQNLDAILVFGGDGTILRAVPFALKSNAPLLGINYGKLGFLSESQPLELKKTLTSIVNKKYKTEERMLIQVSIKRDDKIIASYNALNDAVIYKGLVPGLIDVKFYADKRFVFQPRCDGIIVSTPTGSTAYSLSAGGPIISPTMQALIVAPLNPHILSIRPMVFDSTTQLHFITINLHKHTILQVDGENCQTLQAGDEIFVTQSNSKIKFIKLSNKTFYQILRKKLHMGKS